MTKSMDSAETDAMARVLGQVADERHRQHKKWGQQNHPSGTGDQVPLLHGRPLPKPHDHVPVTLGTLAYTARTVTDESAAAGTVTYADILLEEVAEALAEDNESAVRAELIQVAAVAVAWIEAIDRRASAADTDPRPICDMCRRRRTISDAYDYNPLQAITGQPLGWYSGDDGEICPQCMERTVRGQP